jgi:hypothetical protein
MRQRSGGLRFKPSERERERERHEPEGPLIPLRAAWPTGCVPGRLLAGNTAVTSRIWLCIASRRGWDTSYSLPIALNGHHSPGWPPHLVMAHCCPPVGTMEVCSAVHLWGPWKFALQGWVSAWKQGYVRVSKHAKQASTAARPGVSIFHSSSSP